MTCRRCGAGPLAPDHHRHVPRRRRHASRGLCWSCWHEAARNDELPDWPRSTWPAEDLVAEAELVRNTRRPAELGREFLTWPQVAEVLGVPFPTLDKARQRVAQRARSAA